MRPPVLLAALLWLCGVLAEEDPCHSQEQSPTGERGGPHPSVNVSSQGSPTSLFLSWAAPEPGGAQRALRLVRLSPLGSPGGQRLQALTNASSFEFQGLVPGSRYQLEVTALRPCGQNVTVTLTARTAPSPVQGLQLHSPGSPPSLEASWSEGPGEQDGYQLLLHHRESKTLAQNASVPPDTLSYDFGNLLPGAEYVLEVITWAGSLQTKTSLCQWTAPVSPDHLGLHALGTSTLRASWGGSEGAAWLQLVLTDLLGGTNLTAVIVGRGVSNYTFLHLSPGTPYELTLNAIAGPHRAAGPSATEWTYPSAPLDLVLMPLPPRLWASWKVGPGARDGFLLRLSGPVEENATLGAGALSAMFPGPLPAGHYTLQLRVLAGPYGAWAQACTWLDGPAALPGPCNGTELQLHGLEATREPGRRALLYAEGAPGLVGNISVPCDATHITLCGLVPGSRYRVDITSSLGAITQSLVGYTRPLAPPLVNVTSEGPTQLRASWVHASGGWDGYQVNLYRAGVLVGTRATGAEADSASFSALMPGTEYEVEVVSRAGPLHAAATNVSGWTSPLTPSELLVSTHAGTAVVSLAWASGPWGRGTCHTQLWEAGRLSRQQPLALGQARLVLRGLTPGRDLSLSVLCQAGPRRAATLPVVLPVEPGPVEDVQCQPEATRLALTWTAPAGDVGACLVVAEQLGPGGSAGLVFQANVSRSAALLPGLAPATPYRLSLSVRGRNGLRSRAVTLVCATSAEAWRPPESAPAPQLEPGTEVGVRIVPGMFGQDDGQIQWYGVIATTNMSLARPSQKAINHTWYDHYYRGHDSYLAILLPNPFYPGPWAAPSSWTVPVGVEDCGHTQEICNGQLKPGSQYRFSVAAFTRRSPPGTVISFSAFSEPRASVSPAAVPLPAVVGVAAGCVLVTCAVLGLLCWRRAKGQRRTHRPTPIHSFRQSYEAKSAHAHRAFFLEFEELKEVGKEQPRLEGEHPANTAKNRYPHVLPYDHSRVRLTRLEGEPHSDYINANFIPGYTHPQEFIATQGPLKKTLEDFWRLVWEQRVQVIAMLTVGMENGRVLCEHYWPDSSVPVTHGHITIHLLAEEPEDAWTKREFQLQHAAQHRQRRVKQLQFTAWPDHSVPQAPGALLAFAELVREQARAARGAGPVLVHCSGGVGRTGTFVALSRLLRQLEEEQTVDVFHAVYALRLHRPLMIQTPSQYVFLHSCLLNKILDEPSDISESRPIPVTSFAEACARRAANANAGFLKEYELLLQAIRDEAGSPTPPPGHQQDSTVSYDRSQVRFSPVEESPPDDMPEAWLFPGGPSGRDHVVVTGRTGPEELWELVWQRGARVLVSLCPPDALEKPREFWPTEIQPIVTDAVTVHWMAETNAAGWPCTLFRVTHGESGKERQVQRLQFPYWEPGHELPTATLLAFLTAVGQCCSRGRNKKPGTLLSHSSEGAAQLGTFLAMEQLLQQAESECTVDVFNVALQQSQACGLMTPTLEQYIYFYDCLHSALVDGLP
nr:receptor-type tyrosine-protein phosphatase V-like isoform X2 [Microcebus murinus]